MWWYLFSRRPLGHRNKFLIKIVCGGIFFHIFQKSIGRHPLSARASDGKSKGVDNLSLSRQRSN
jgi:hypothetical protein